MAQWKYVCHRTTKTERSIVFPTAIPSSRWNNWGKCGNSTLQKKKNPANGGGKEEEEEGQWWKPRSNKSEQRAVPQRSATVLCQSLFPCQYVCPRRDLWRFIAGKVCLRINTTQWFTFLVLRLRFLCQSSHVSIACKVAPTLKPKGNTWKM